MNQDKYEIIRRILGLNQNIRYYDVYLEQFFLFSCDETVKNFIEYFLTEINSILHGAN